MSHGFVITGDLRREHFPVDIGGQLWVIDFRLLVFFRRVLRVMY